MAGALVFLQHEGGRLSRASLGALSAARQLQQYWRLTELCGLCLGASARVAAEEALQFGLERVLFSEAAGLEKFVSSTYCGWILQALSRTGAEALVAAGTSTGKDLLPRVAGRWDAAQATDVCGVSADGSLQRYMYAGNIVAEIELVGSRRCVTIRTSTFPPAQKDAVAGAIEELPAPEETVIPGVEVQEYRFSGGGRPELSDARIIVSGGRGLQSAQAFQQCVLALADRLGAAVGASRAAVDAGYAPNDWQVGQTGKTVAPELYIALGISGAIQHLAGMRGSRVVIAINKDKDAPIFDISDYGVVGDVQESVQTLLKLLNKPA